MQVGSIKVDFLAGVLIVALLISWSAIVFDFAIKVIRQMTIWFRGYPPPERASLTSGEVELISEVFLEQLDAARYGDHPDEEDEDDFLPSGV